MNDDTIKLLRECNAGIKMGISTLDDVMNDVKNGELREILSKSKEKHSRLEAETDAFLARYQDTGKEPAAIAKIMSKIKSNVKTMSGNIDEQVADVITEGCNMGVKSLYRYLNQYPTAEKPIKDLAEKIIDEEEHLTKQLRAFL